MGGFVCSSSQLVYQCITGDLHALRSWCKCKNMFSLQTTWLQIIFTYMNFPLVHLLSLSRHPSAIFQEWREGGKKWEEQKQHSLLQFTDAFLSTVPFALRVQDLCLFFLQASDSEPVGWSLITTEWAANGCLHHSPAPDPHPTLHSLSWVSMVTCSWVARGLLLEVDEVEWLKGGPDPCAFCATWIGIMLINGQFLWHLTVALIYKHVQAVWTVKHCATIPDLRKALR